MKIYLDLDRTLFNTAIAPVVLWNELARLYPTVDAAAEQARQADFYVSVPPDSYYYDFSSQLVACGIDPVVAANQLTNSPIADDRLLLTGAAVFVKQLESAGHDVEILTFGETYFQTLKARLCPSLAGVPVHVILGPKAAFLADKGRCIMVDDKNITNELPQNVRFFWVQLADEPTSQGSDGAFDTLTAVGDEIAQITG